MSGTDAFEPDWVSPPGDTMRDLIDDRNLTIAEFARQIGHTPEEATCLLQGQMSLTTETAQKLEVVLGSSARFWLTRESQYRSDVARLQDTGEHLDVEGWLRELPLSDMIDFGCVDPSADASRRTTQVLQFFGVSGLAEWRTTYREILGAAAFRTSASFDSKPGAVSVWLRQGEIRGSAINCAPWNPQRVREVLPNIRTLTRKKDPNAFLPELTNQLAGCGVALAIVRAPTGCRASGATRFLTPARAMLLLSLRYLSDDQFWFTLFHELGHLVLHGDTSLFLEEDEDSLSRQEIEANEFAEAIIVPNDFRQELLTLRIEMRRIVRFAHRIGVSSGLVVGQLQHLGRVPHSHFNGLKVKFDWQHINI